MNQVFFISADCPEIIAATRATVIAEFMRGQQACPFRPLPGPGGPAAAAPGFTISIECWRDANNKLHCKLTLGTNASAL